MQLEVSWLWKVECWRFTEVSSLRCLSALLSMSIFYVNLNKMDKIRHYVLDRYGDQVQITSGHTIHNTNQEVVFLHHAITETSYILLIDNDGNLREITREEYERLIQKGDGP